MLCDEPGDPSLLLRCKFYRRLRDYFVTPESLIFSKMFGQLLREDVVSVVRLGKSYQTGNAADWAMAILCWRFLHQQGWKQSSRFSCVRVAVPLPMHFSCKDFARAEALVNASPLGLTGQAARARSLAQRLILKTIGPS